MNNELTTRSGNTTEARIHTDAKGAPYFMERKVCSRCGGDGIWKGHFKGVCFGCGGQGDKGHRKVKLYTAEQNAKLDAAQAKRDAKRAAKHEAIHNAFVETAQIAREIFDAENPGFEFYLEVIAETDFGADLAAKLEEWGSLSAKQVDAVIIMAGNRIDAEAAKRPVIEGHIEITGEVLTTKTVESQFGSTLKMLVADDRGFKVWGTVPKSLQGEWNGEETVGRIAKGDRVVFCATVARSDDDESFGFYKRPSKAAIINEKAAA